MKKKHLPFRIVHEDHEILVIDKPHGLLTATVPREKRPTALAAVREHVAGNEPRARVGLIHRLDRDAAGLLVFSKSHDAYVSLKQQFYRHTVERIYLAVVRGKPTPRQGTIDTLLVESNDGSMHRTRDPRKGERAITHYQAIAEERGRSLLRVRLETGKKHQIRAQLAERAVPIINDPMYNTDKPAGPLMLVAVELHLDHPRTKRRMSFRIDPPADWGFTDALETSRDSLHAKRRS
jgi:23S rRNA pseudouridine1911/1915/1917 synthase